MDLIVRKGYRCIKPFEIHDLPDFVVLTGENGSGKTQLLNYLLMAGQMYGQGSYNIDEDEDLDMSDIFLEETIDENTGEMKLVLPIELLENGVTINNVIKKGVQSPRIDVGENFNWKTIYEDGLTFKHKYITYIDYIETHDTSKVSLEELSNNYRTSIGIRGTQPYSNRDVKLPSISQNDFDIFNRIEKEIDQPNQNKAAYYYISFLNIPNTGYFATNFKCLNFKYWARINAGLPTGAAPWEEFNNICKSLNFKYEVDTPKIHEQKFDVRLRDRNNKKFISPNSLSSGEKVMFSMFMAMYHNAIMRQHPQCIIFDEPDAYLHPSLTLSMIDILRTFFIEKYGIKVIITTHSPTTVALTPECSIFKMEDGIMAKTSKKDAILSLTKGLNDISIYYDKVKQVLVEADNDNVVISRIYKHALDWQKQELLDKTIKLKVVNVGNSTGGGCTMVNKVIDALAEEENSNLYGIIDWDGKNESDKRRIVLGGKNRYAIDNYILDPLALSLLFLANPENRTKIGFDENDQLTGFAKKTHDQKQSYINNIIALLETGIGKIRTQNKNPHEYEIMNGEKFTIPQWFCNIQGHQLYADIQENIRFLNRYTNEKDLYTAITDTCYGNYPEIIPMDIIKTLKEIQDLN